jgi:hypothetical protein
LKDAKNTWLQEYSQTFETKVRGQEMPGKPMELAGILSDGSKFDITDLRGKPAVVCFYKAFPIPADADLPPDMRGKVGSAMPPLLQKLKLYDATYASKDLGIVVYLTNKEHQDFPKPDETMKHWKIMSAEDSVAGGLKNYRDYYGFTSTSSWFLVDRAGNVVDTKDDNFDSTLKALMQEN